MLIPEFSFRKAFCFYSQLGGGLGGCSCHRSHSLSFTLTSASCLFLLTLSPVGPECVPAFSKLVLVLVVSHHTCYGSPPDLCNLEPPPPHTHTRSPCLTSSLSQTTTDRALCLLSSGAPNPTSGDCTQLELCCFSVRI